MLYPLSYEGGTLREQEDPRANGVHLDMSGGADRMPRSCVPQLTRTGHGDPLW